MFPEKLLDAIPSFLKSSLQCGELVVVVPELLFPWKDLLSSLSAEVTLPATTLFFLCIFENFTYENFIETIVPVPSPLFNSCHAPPHFSNSWLLII